MLINVRFGFGEHGHMVGRPAVIAVFDVDGDAAIPVPAMADVPVTVPAIIMVRTKVLDDAQAESLVTLYREFRATGRVVHVCVRPNVMLRDDEMAYASILRVIDCDDFDHPPRCDDRYASVSIHCWPGSPVMEHLTRLRAEQGRYIVVDGEDFGHAKVWLQGAPDRGAWTLTRCYPFNDTVETPELEEMFVRGLH